MMERHQSQQNKCRGSHRPPAPTTTFLSLHDLVTPRRLQSDFSYKPIQIAPPHRIPKDSRGGQLMTHDKLSSLSCDNEIIYQLIGRQGLDIQSLTCRNANHPAF
ncbi:hypothetical protein BLNAU_6034 [Blattamonas nauphoetae]|uniref:Uncharacterized protein n=1 Tax=Blattamonas nauphoetae TaxID=2049346 RepID=A0ABQ9XHP4_9EUKA|nr:hypothetical protein BLNAU_18405 [Blattamonas nauphoetae]KAK2950364.1 hypothetical protein BLNAU_14699 [Blattamonas nauphoetae]KAK2959018.1 hypothetical protein BLNAU_6034 [Blattamonas nauphoetae]